ncbi:MAG: trigger factor [Barnesiella sp.]|nr:trigger factor [Bacteroidales bacterium]MBD5246518.1 trigger factor [Barnesiella sp.]MBD5248713.1 trigger factor [Barnesiella sp.]
MNVELQKIGDYTGKFVVTVNENDYAETVTKRLKEIGKTHNFPGFRKGHVPFGQLVRQFGKEVKSEVLNNEVYRAVITYIQDNKLQVLGEPIPVELKEISMEQKDYTFEYEIGLAPEINVNLADVTVPYYEIEVSDKMIEDEDNAYRERFGAQVPGEEVDNKAVIKGSIFELNADGTVKETEDAIQVIDGIIAPFYFTNKDEEAKFIGKKVGDKVVFNPAKTCNDNVTEVASMLHIEDKNKAAEIKGDFEFTISEIIVVKKAEHNEEFFTNVFGKDKVHNEEEYTAAVKERIAAQLAQNSNMLFRFQSEKILIEKYGNFDLPAEFLKKWLMLRNPEQLNAANIDEEYTKLIPVFKWELIRGNIAEQLKIELKEEDVNAFAKMIAARQFAQYGMTNMDDSVLEDYAKRMLADKNTRQRIAESVMEEKLYNGIKAKVNLDTKTVSFDEFKTIAEEAQK